LTSKTEKDKLNQVVMKSGYCSIESEEDDDGATLESAEVDSTAAGVASEERVFTLDGFSEIEATEADAEEELDGAADGAADSLGIYAAGLAW
jgi:hypothetical protein